MAKQQCECDQQLRPASHLKLPAKATTTSPPLLLLKAAITLHNLDFLRRILTDPSQATEEAQHLKKLIQEYIASFIKVGDKVVVGIKQVDVELETTLQHPQHILEKVSDDEILNVEEEISENEENESLDDEEWDDNENETTEEEEWGNDGIETSEEE
ncbi:hypothetical protein H5410_021052 [Solanum commersonii]|uniref:Uncharacterized protein n=1 Tax=Solanum commersonii TaxID=4109 RepID=A0A9J5Z9V7_SOLCO|nr:hypothetical protein H5410_021052 [Solanum commersonii]